MAACSQNFDEVNADDGDPSEEANEEVEEHGEVEEDNESDEDEEDDDIASKVFYSALAEINDGRDDDIDLPNISPDERRRVLSEKGFLTMPIAEDYMDMRDKLCEEKRELELQYTGIVPMFKSMFMHKLRYAANNAWVSSHPMRITLFSGGKINCTLQMLKNSLDALANDIDNGIAITVNELAINTDGVRVYFELDMRGFSLPWTNDIITITTIAQELLRECFPSNEANVLACVATCRPKLKSVSETGDKLLASGLHIVFPHIVVTTSVLKMLCVVLNERITNWNYAYTNIVDAQPVHSDDASLRLIFAHKLTRCKICKHSKATNVRDPFYSVYTGKDCKKLTSIYNNKIINKKTLAAVSMDGFRSSIESFDVDILPDPGMNVDNNVDDDVYTMRSDTPLAAGCGSCYHGKVISPYVYVPRFAVVANGDVDDDFFDDMTTINMLKHLMINPVFDHQQQGYTSGFIAPNGCTFDILDTAPSGHVMFKEERATINRVVNRARQVRARESPALYEMFSNIIRSTFGGGAYTNVVVDKVAVKDRCIFINLSGKGSRFCCRANREHGQRVYMQLSQSGELSMRCYSRTCKPIISTIYASRGKKNVMVNNDDGSAPLLPTTHDTQMVLGKCMRLPSISDEDKKLVTLATRFKFTNTVRSRKRQRITMANQEAKAANDSLMDELQRAKDAVALAEAYVAVKRLKK
jgi:hypothetical protein